jgi:hypothetical protein
MFLPANGRNTEPRHNRARHTSLEASPSARAWGSTDNGRRDETFQYNNLYSRPGSAAAGFQLVEQAARSGRSAMCAFARVFDALRHLRGGMKNAAPRLGHPRAPS